MSKKILFVSDKMPFGGTTMFLKNICNGLSKTAEWRGSIATLRTGQPQAMEAIKEGLEVITPGSSSHIHEDRVRDIYHHCQRIKPLAVVATLGSGSFELLRNVPKGCLRIGMVQSDHPSFYDLIDRYKQWLDMAVGVSHENCIRIAERTGTLPISIHQLPYGVPMADDNSAPPRHIGEPLRILYLGRLDEEQKRFSLLCDVISYLQKAIQVLSLF